MSEWDKDYVDAEVPAFIEFEDDQLGSFQFGYIQADIDYRTVTRDGEISVEFSWEGMDGADLTPCSGRGWANLEEGGLNGAIFIHRGDESDFTAEREKPKKKPRR